MVNNGLYVPTIVWNGATSIKLEGFWDDDDHKKVLYDKKAKNIIAFALGMDEFFKILNCKTTKEIWDTLETIQEGTEEANMTLMTSHNSDSE